MEVGKNGSIEDRLLVLFDGRCGFCNRWVRWLVRRDNRDRLRFAALERARELGFAVPEDSGPDNEPNNAGTLIVVRSPAGAAGQIATRSSAVLAILAELPQPWPAISLALRWIPRPWRDAVYRAVARHRYRLAGQAGECPLPGEKERLRFL